VGTGGTGVGVGATVTTLVAVAKVAVAAGVVSGLLHANTQAMAERAITADGRFMLENMVKGTNCPVVRDRIAFTRVPYPPRADHCRLTDL
jgi:hypothetical protein